MPDIRKVVRIFLGFPGDLPEERTAVKTAIEELNSLHAERLGIQIDFIGWETTPSSFGRPQERINEQLERCEYFIGLMWKRWGTPPSTSGPYSSGFEEEFRRSVDRRQKENKPEISLFFKEVDQASLNDPGDELKKVQTFQRELIDKDAVFSAAAARRSCRRQGTDRRPRFPQAASNSRAAIRRA